MAQEQVDIFETIAKGTVTLGELKAALSDAKKALEGMTVGEEQYQQQLKDVITLQNAVRGAMNGTTASMEDVAKAADGTSKTYNGLVNQMANMKRELRNIDVSTEEGAKAFEDLAKKINDVNDELKEMDAMKGDFQRNVGNYKSALDGVGGILTQMPPTLGSVKKSLGDVGQTMQLVGKQPILGIIGLLAPIISEIVKGLKENDAALAGVKKGMEALKPVMDFFSGILETIGTFLGDLISKAASFLSSNGIFQKVIQGVMGVGNAILKFVVAPFKGVVAAIKVFKEQGVKGLGDAAKAFGQEMKAGVAFKENFQAGTFVADALIQGAKSKKPDAKKAGKEIGKEIGQGVIEGLDEILDKIDEKWNKRLDDRQKLHEKRQKEIADYNKEQAQKFLEEQEAEAEALAEEWTESYNKQIEEAKEAAEKRMEIMQAYASGTSDLLNTLADLVEAQGSEDEKAVKATKNLRIAAATIDMIQGAVTAFSTAQQLGPIAGPIVGAINAAAVVASGLANIAKIKSTKVSKDSTPSTAAPDTPSATVTAPALETAVPQTTVVEGASQEQRLNRAASPQKVYILQSDIEAAGDTSRVQVAESSF